MRWGAYSAPPDLLAAFNGPTSREREGGKGLGGSPGSSDFAPPGCRVLERDASTLQVHALAWRCGKHSLRRITGKLIQEYSV